MSLWLLLLTLPNFKTVPLFTLFSNSSLLLLFLSRFIPPVCNYVRLVGQDIQHNSDSVCSKSHLIHRIRIVPRILTSETVQVSLPHFTQDASYANTPAQKDRTPNYFCFASARIHLTLDVPKSIPIKKDISYTHEFSNSRLLSPIPNLNVDL